MKKILAVLVAISLVLALTACGTSSRPSVDPGTYRREGLASETLLIFSGSDKITLRVFVGGYEVFSEEGSYSLSEDETEITLDFSSTEETDEELSDESMSEASALNGTLHYSHDEGSVTIGNFTFIRTGDNNQ